MRAGMAGGYRLKLHKALLSLAQPHDHNYNHLTQMLLGEKKSSVQYRKSADCFERNMS